jgi:transposase-like protein
MVSNAAKKLDEVLNTWRERPLGKIEYLVFCKQKITNI